MYTTCCFQCGNLNLILIKIIITNKIFKRKMETETVIERGLKNAECTPSNE